MDMQIARLSNISWLQIPDRQAVAMRSVWQRPDRSWSHSAKPASSDPQPIPMLDWPATLFQDEIVEH